MKQGGSMPELLNGLVGAGNYNCIKSEYETGERRNYRPKQQFVFIHSKYRFAGKGKSIFIVFNYESQFRIISFYIII